MGPRVPGSSRASSELIFSIKAETGGRVQEGTSYVSDPPSWLGQSLSLAVDPLGLLSVLRETCVTVFCLETKKETRRRIEKFFGIDETRLGLREHRLH